MRRLNQLLREGRLESVSRLNVLGSSLEPTPLFVWDRYHLLTLEGDIIGPQERLRPEHLHAEKGPLTGLTPGIVKPFVRIDIRFLRTDFIAAWGQSNYPPAEAGGFIFCEPLKARSKRLEGDADASPAHCAT